MISAEIVSIIEIFAFIFWLYGAMIIFAQKRISMNKRRRMLFWFTLVMMSIMILCIGGQGSWGRLKL